MKAYPTIPLSDKSNLVYRYLKDEVCILLLREEIMSGSLRNSRGTKVTVILLDTVMVVGRTVSRPGVGKIIQVRHQSITQADSHPAGHGHGRGADCLPPWH
jgi:hypothetical protein